MERLFTPGRIGTLELPNRIVRSATAEWLADDEGVPRPEMTELYRRLAQGGVGLIISGHLFVHPTGRGYAGMTGIHDDTLIEPLRAITSAVHREGARIAAQLNHAGLKRAVPGPRPVAPSAIGPPLADPASRALEEREILELVDAFGAAAQRASEAGFDAVQIHAAHGYLVNQFLSPATNHRHDAWGGNEARRAAFLRRVCAAVRSGVGSGFPVLIKLAMLDNLTPGLTVEASRRIVATLRGMGIDAVETSGGLSVEPGFSGPAGASEPYFRELSRAAKGATDLPVLLVGGVRTRSQMESILGESAADFVSLCRPLICEPDLPRRLRTGEQDAARCTSCNRCRPVSDEGISCKLDAVS
jgi:2,4-dienoyl-CoA reductase-like NADH-dependent reductase (Old Yellow Enzyme family)